jgi:hypothetical protein
MEGLFERWVETLIGSWAYLASGSPRAELVRADDAAIAAFGHWVHESQAEVAAELGSRGYAFDSATRTMAMPVDELEDVDGSALEVIEPGPAEFWAVDGPGGLVPELDPAGAYFCVARLDGESVSMLMAFEQAGDCGIYMVAADASGGAAG